jgi:hypothetical protein
VLVRVIKYTLTDPNLPGYGETQKFTMHLPYSAGSCGRMGCGSFFSSEVDTFKEADRCGQ